MSNKLCLVLSVLFTATTLLAACAPAAAPVQPTSAPTALTGPSATAAPVQPTPDPGEMPQSGNPCGGTGGLGEIVSVGGDGFTMRRTDDGSNQIVHLTGGVTVITSAGTGAVSDLKVGEHVVLVGGPNPDGSFTAYTVAVCSGSQ